MSNNQRAEPSLEATRAFVHVARSSGFTQASRVTGLSVSRLSRLVRELEEALGAQLLSRTTRRVLLTEAGALFLSHAEALLTAQRAAIDAVTELVGGVPRGTLRVSMPVAVGERLLGPSLPRFLERYPELALEVDLSDRNVEVIAGGFDLVIRVGRLGDSSLRAQLLGRVPRLLVASPRYLELYGEPSGPEALIGHRIIGAGALPGATEWTFHPVPGGEPVTVAVTPHLATTSPTLAVQLATSGLGLLRTTAWVMRRELAQGRLVPVMQGHRCEPSGDGGVPFWVVYAQGPGVTPPLKSRVFVELVQEVVAADARMDHLTAAGRS